MNTTYFFVDPDNEPQGPISTDDFGKYGITRETQVWCEGMEAWQEAGSLPELSIFFSPPPPAPPPAPPPPPAPAAPPPAPVQYVAEPPPPQVEEQQPPQPLYVAEPQPPQQVAAPTPQPQYVAEPPTQQIATQTPQPQYVAEPQPQQTAEPPRRVHQTVEPQPKAKKAVEQKQKYKDAVVKPKKSRLGLIVGVVAAVILLAGGYWAYIQFLADEQALLVSINDCIHLPDDQVQQVDTMIIVGNTVQMLVDKKVKLSVESEVSAEFPILKRRFNRDVNWRWSSNDETVATVDSLGVVTGIDKGSVTITVTDDMNSINSSSVTINVKFPPIESITLFTGSNIISVGETLELSYDTYPENTDKSTLEWSSSEPAVATVDQSGTVSAVGGGLTIITLSDSKEGVSDQIEIHVSGGASSIPSQTQLVPQPPPPPPPPPQQATPSDGQGTISYSFGSYSGNIGGGRPNGNGTMNYTCRVRIASHGSATVYAEAGDRFVGVWANGDISNGFLFDQNNATKAVINAGRRTTAYDLRNDRCE